MRIRIMKITTLHFLFTRNISNTDTDNQASKQILGIQWICNILEDITLHKVAHAVSLFSLHYFLLSLCSFYREYTQ